MTVQFPISSAQIAASVETTSSSASDRASFGDDSSFMSFESVLSDSFPESDGASEQPKLARRSREIVLGREETATDIESEQGAETVPVAVVSMVENPDQPNVEAAPMALAGQIPPPDAVPSEPAVGTQAPVTQILTSSVPPAITPSGAMPDSSAGATVPADEEGIAPAADNVPIAASPKPEMAFAARLQATPAQGGETEQVNAAPQLDSAGEPPARASVKTPVSGAEQVGTEKWLPQEKERRTLENSQPASRSEASHWMSAAPARMETARSSAAQTSTASEVREVVLPLENKADVESARGPIREIRLNLTEPGQGRTELRLMDRDGQVGLAVRTDNSEVATALRGNLNDLTHRLERLGYSTEVWSPQSAQEPLNTAARKSQAGDQQKQSGQDGRDRQTDEHGGGQRRQQQRPHWMNEFESIMGASRQ